LAIIVSGVLVLAAFAVSAVAAPGSTTVSGVTTPFNGVWLDSGDGGHYWDAGANGLCRVDVTPNGSIQNSATCDVQVHTPTQVVVGPQRSDGTYFLYVADMSAGSAGPVRLAYDPSADGGAGRVVADSALVVGGAHSAGFFGDSGGSFRSSSVALGPCDASITTACTALYVAFQRSPQLERIDFVDQPAAAQAIETISKADEPRKGVRFGIADFHNADGTDDIYVDELAGTGVSVLKNVANCSPSQGSPDPTVTDPPADPAGGCAATAVTAVTTHSAQGIAVQRDADGTGRYLYIADSPANATPTVLRYHPDSGFQDVISNSVTPYASLLNSGQTVATYTSIGGLAVNSTDGDLYIGDDPTLPNEANAAKSVGHIFTIAGDADQTAPADCTGSAANPCAPAAPPGTVTAGLYADGVTAPAGGLTFLPSDDGGHVWLADEGAGFCRFDLVPSAPALHASNPAACDDAALLGSGGQSVYDDSVVPGTTDQHYVYVAQNDHLSPGVIRFTFDPSADSGAGDLVAGSAVVMAPNAGLDGDRANGLALGPCVAGAPTTCRHALYVAGLLDGFVRRINNPEDAPRVQSVDVVAMTTAQAIGQPGRGINGSMGMLGNDLYLPEDKGFTVVKDITACPEANNVVCPTAPLNIGGASGEPFGAAVAVDPNPEHSAAGLVYGSDSEDGTAATIYQYDVATNTSRVYTTKGQVPPAGSAAATVYCTLMCTRPVDPGYAPGTQASFKFAQGLFVDPRSDDVGGGTLYISEDPLGGTRGQRGHLWTAPFVPYPPGATSVPIPPGGDPTAVTCAVTVPVPALPLNTTYWVQFTAHDPGVLTSTWQLPVAQSAQLQVYSGAPFTGLTDPVVVGSLAGAVAKQVTTNSSTFDVTTAPAPEPAGTYTVQFLNTASALPATNATITYVNDAATPCPASPLVGHVAT
jgi:hypothetical protein